MPARPCDKVRYFSRRAARYARRRWHPGQHLNPYWCLGCRGWHLGHLAPSVLHGLRTKQELYG